MENENKFDPNNPPICFCGKTAIMAQAGIIKNIPYWYCPDCKIEISQNNTYKELLEDMQDYYFWTTGVFDD